MPFIYNRLVSIYNPLVLVILKRFGFGLSPNYHGLGMVLQKKKIRPKPTIKNAAAGVLAVLAPNVPPLQKSISSTIFSSSQPLYCSPLSNQSISEPSLQNFQQTKNLNLQPHITPTQTPTTKWKTSQLSHPSTSPLVAVLALASTAERTSPCLSCEQEKTAAWQLVPIDCIPPSPTIARNKPL
jgi:hypothetical protein